MYLLVMGVTDLIYGSFVWGLFIYLFSLYSNVKIGMTIPVVEHFKRLRGELDFLSPRSEHSDQNVEL